MATPVTLPHFRLSALIYNPQEILGANPYPLRFITATIAANLTVNLITGNAFLLPIGSIVVLATSGANSGKYELWTAGASDGSQTLVGTSGILYENIDTSQGAQGAQILISGNVLQDKLFAGAATTVPAAGGFLFVGSQIQLEASIVPGAPF